MEKATPVSPRRNIVFAEVHCQIFLYSIHGYDFYRRNFFDSEGAFSTRNMQSGSSQSCELVAERIRAGA